ncbi:MAG: RNA polymerase sigma-70 factor [Bacteroidota bacterium]
MYAQYVRYVYTICFEQLGDKNESHEITSKIFISLWERRDSIKIESSIKNYLRKAAKLKIIDFLRSQERTERKLQNAIKEFCSFDNTTENELSYNELQNRIEALVAELPSRCKEVFILSRKRGLSIKEIAFHLSISENTVKTHLANAINHLRSQLNDYVLPKRATG